MKRKRFFLSILLGLMLLLLVLAVKTHAEVSSSTFSSTKSMSTPRLFHTATLLPNGKVLVAGGQDKSDILASAELYDPTSGTWSTTGSMSIPRMNHTATLLSNGKVLVTGGQYKNGIVASGELYDPISGTWSITKSMSTPRLFHTATLLPNGKVLVVGGEHNYGTLASAELYDPTRGTWSATASMSIPRMNHTVALLSNGKVLVAGGQDKDGVLASAEMYDPASGNWSTTGSMSTSRMNHTATVLSNGKVLVAGGQDKNDILASAELYDPTSGTWSVTTSMSTPRLSHTATVLSNGKVLVAGGQDKNDILASTELYDPTSSIWSATPNMSTPRMNHTATLLSNGEILIAGGQDKNDILASAELFSLDTTALTLQLPRTMTVNTTSSQGTVVSYTVTATDTAHASSQITITCAPPSGSTFSVGTTTVLCSAQDPAGNTGTGSFQVVVINTKAPRLQLPGTITANATSPQGAVVNYTVTATAPGHPSNQITITCVPPSGSTFSIGTTAVVCSAQDPAGNTGTGSFQVAVIGLDTTAPTQQSGTTTVNTTSPQAANTTAPTLQLPGTITTNATSTQGTVVNYTVTATDSGYPSNQITITCTPPSGSTFPIGTTTVQCRAQDPAGNTSTGSFQIVVIGLDTTAPTLQLPGTITVNAISLQGAVVNYTVTATDPDNSSDQITINCTHPSGILFSIGITTVHCSAQDPAGNTSTGSFQVVVIGSGLSVANLSSLI